MAFPALEKCPLFDGVQPHEYDAMLKCLSATERSFGREDFVIQAGEEARYVGIVLLGGVHVVQEDYWGNRTILTDVEEGGLFAEAFCCAGAVMPVSVVAYKASRILLIDYGKIISACPGSCMFHERMVRNMLAVLARKNMMLTGKMEHLSRRTIREKLLSYFSSLAVGSGTSRFEIPFDRQQLADYLSIDRSALSRELSKMRDEGLLDYSKNSFRLLGGE